jgi:hypothetical protein
MLTATKTAVAGLAAAILLASTSLVSRMEGAPGLSTSLANQNREVAAERNVKVEQTARSVIETLFREKKRTDAFVRYFRFSELSREEKSALEKLGYDPSDEATRYKNSSTGSRALTVSWNYAYQPVLLVLGTTDLTSGQEFKESFEKAQTTVEEERNRALAKRGLSEEQFYSLLDLKAAKDSETLERNLTILEQLDADLDQFIEQKTNPATLSGNIKKIEESMLIEKHAVAGRTLYEVHFKPMFKMVFLQQGGELKMVAFGDVV